MPCCMRSMVKPVRRYGPAAIKSNRSITSVGCPSQMVVSTSEPTTECSTASASHRANRSIRSYAMNKTITILVLASICVILSRSALVQGQGRGGAEWTTAFGDAQHSSWVRSDPKISTASMQKGGFQSLWKMKLHNKTHELNSLTPPVLLDRLVGFRGFKSIAVVGASADTVYAIDFDLGKPLWTFVLNYSADNEVPAPTWNCPGGLMAAATRPTAVSISAGGGDGVGGRGGRTGGSVGEPGKG